MQFTSNVPLPRQIEAARAMGVRRVRIGLYWESVENARGDFHWEQADARVGAVLRAGLIPLVTLFGRDPTAPISPVDRGKRVPPASGPSLEAFGRFAAAVAQHYGPGRPEQPVLYEVWNEPNTRTFWGSPPNPEDYARMAETACRSIKALGAQYRVLGLVMEGTPVKAPYFVPAYNIDIYRQWADRAASPALMKCVDGFSMHPYRPQPESYLADERALATFVAAHSKRSEAPLIVNGEWGYTSVQKQGDAADLQAARDLRLLLIGAGLGRVTNIYQAVDGGADPTRNGASFGLASYDGHLKLSGLAVQRLLKLVGSWQIEGVGPLPGIPDTYRFTAIGRKKALILWTGEGKQAAVPVDKGVSALDLVSGTPRPIVDNMITLDDHPVLIL